MMDADTRQCLAEKVMLKRTKIFDVIFHLHAIFFKSIENSMILPTALSRRFSFLMNWCLCMFVAVSHVDRGWWASFSAEYCREWASFSATSGHLEVISVNFDWYSNRQNHCSKCCTCWQPSELSIEAVPVVNVTSFLRINGCSCMSVHVPTSFYRRKKNDHLSCKTVEHRTRKV